MIHAYRNNLGRPCPKWLCTLLSRCTFESPLPPRVTVYTLLQVQFCGHILREGALFNNLIVDAVPGEREQLLLRAALAHSRPICRLHMWNGDAVAHIDITAEFLTCRGIALTASDSDLQRLRRVTAERQYILPFWLTQGEVELLFLHSVIWCKLQLENFSLHEVNHLFTEHAVSLTESSIPFLNLQELVDMGLVNDARFLRNAINLFRIFKPINIFTKRPFDQCIEDRIRVESIMSQCWCTIWGTPSDFRNANIETFEDPVGIYVMDGDGSESFLINAFSTRDPLGAYCKVYANHFIYIV